MQTTTPTVAAPRVRPLWERSELFREPTYDPTITLDDQDDNGSDSEDDEPRTSAR
ncbi:hypothetical protein [Streptomyces sp. LUP47B]|uniref:hypothetical protein n=1 Tax=Streptomyces sp. LUP47B TaxID=1890286 RepID=UPI00159F2BAE|nr:hypothetical protein [Streptomyces sp. LUP47B]